MLKSLLVKNYALIDEINVVFNHGLNIITGETGAGKSIIIGAMGLLLGDRAQTEFVRQGADKAIVEGVFILPKDTAKVVSDFIELDGKELILRREVYSNGRSRAFANDSPVTGLILNRIGNFIADLHGQHQHQALLNVDTHMKYLDSFGMDMELFSSLEQSFSRYQKLNREFNELTLMQHTAKQKQELLTFQVKQISDADTKQDEEDSLLKEEKILSNAEKIYQTVTMLHKMLYDDENSISENLSKAVSQFDTLINIDPVIEKWRNECDSARISVEEISTGLNNYLSSIEFNPERLQEIRERLGLFNMLKKKYGPTMNEVFAFLKQTKGELDSIENVEEKIKQAKLNLEKEIQILTELCKKVSTVRVKVAEELEKKIEESLQELGLNKAKFEVKLTKQQAPNGPVFLDEVGYEVSPKGIDKAEFFISLNSGEDVRALAKVASGGEISRIMLSLKKVFAEIDNIPVLIFDEIDSGISGRIARIVGKKLKQVSENHQVICITHLPQIASLGDTHYSVVKKSADNRTVTSISCLSDGDRVAEVAKLLGGESVTESTLKSAKELIFGER